MGIYTYVYIYIYIIYIYMLSEFIWDRCIFLQWFIWSIDSLKIHLGIQRIQGEERFRNHVYTGAVGSIGVVGFNLLHGIYMGYLTTINGE